MNKLKRLALSVIFMCVLAVATFAGETQPPTCEPGQTNSPPCSSHVNGDSTDPGQNLIVPGQTSTPASDTAVDVTDIIDAALWALSLF